MYLRFAFEDGAETLEYMAQSMRRKLDLVGVKIGLKGWQAITRAERLALSHFPVDTDDERAAFVQVLRGFAERAGAKVETVAAVDARTWGKERVPDALAPPHNPVDADLVLAEELVHFAWHFPIVLERDSQNDLLAQSVLRTRSRDVDLHGAAMLRRSRYGVQCGAVRSQ
jgi:hypothetical protein